MFVRTEANGCRSVASLDDRMMSDTVSKGEARLLRMCEDSNPTTYKDAWARTVMVHRVDIVAFTTPSPLRTSPPP